MKVNKPFIEAMRHATQLIRTRGPRAATQFIQGLFRTGPPTATNTPQRAADRTVDPARLIEDIVEPIAEVQARTPGVPLELPAASGQFLDKQFSSEAGTRSYKIYVPSGYVASSVPLLVMLHGCTQDPDDFALGTRANRWAQSRQRLVVYPQQVQRANARRCWNWFRPEDQHAGHGEPAIIAGITKQVIDEYQADPRRVYIAGLSAGGAMAAIVGQEYPEIFAAIGVHSGVPAGAAHDVQSAFAVMRSGRSHNVARARSNNTAVPLIVLQGDADRTVNPANASRLIEVAIAARKSGPPLQTVVQSVAATETDRPYRRIRHVAENGTSLVEEWDIHGAGHAWSGGDTAGSYTDGRGPDATKVMLDFFDQHRAEKTEPAPAP